MKKAILISILIHIIIMILFWKVNINKNITVRTETFFEVSMLTSDDIIGPGEVLPDNYTTENIDLPIIHSENELIQEDEMESPEIFDEKKNIIPLNVIEAKKEKIVLPGIGKEISTISRAGAEKRNRIYELSGIINTRRIIVKYIPTYPENYHINTDITIEISVDEKGEIVMTSILKKGGVPFDKISLDAAKKWKFAPLPGSGIQKGKLTFFYRLK